MIKVEVSISSQNVFRKNKSEEEIGRKGKKNAIKSSR
jgi:hypothetical protein